MRWTESFLLQKALEWRGWQKTLLLYNKPIVLLMRQGLILILWKNFMEYYFIAQSQNYHLNNIF